MSAAKRMKDSELKNHGACPCGKSSDAYTEYSDGHGFCYSCSKPFNLQQVKPEQLKKEFVDGYRGISAKTCEFMGIYSYVDDDGNVLYREYTDPNGSKFRRCPKESFWVTGKYPPLGGTHLWNPGSAHYVTVVEGEEDAAAFHEMMNDKKTVHPVVWLTSAGIPKNGRKFIYDYLSKFETVKLAFEGDDAGKRAKEILREMLPNKIKEVPLSKHKDANDFLLAGDADEFKRAWQNATIFTPDNIYHTEENFKSILDNDEVESYIETPFDSLNEKIRGIPLNFVTLITGEEGIGKTEFLRSIEYEIIRAGVPIAVLHQEETKKTFLKKLAGYELLQNCCDPDNPVSNDEVLHTVKKISNNFNDLYYFEFKQDPDVDAIIEQFKYLVHVCSVKYIFIDPINQFDPVDDTPKVEFLDTLAKKSAKFVTTNPVGLVWTAHVNDDGKVRDSRMIAKSAGIRIDLFRDIISDDENSRNQLAMYVKKNRPYGETGFCGFAYWNTDAKIMEDEYETRLEDEGPDDSLPFDAEEQVIDAEYEDVTDKDDEPNIVPFD